MGIELYVEASYPHKTVYLTAFDHSGRISLFLPAVCRIVQCMRMNRRIEDIMDAAQQERRCAVGLTDRDRRALLRRAREGSLERPHRNVYVKSGYWRSLTPHQQHLHTARALAKLHPRWVFAGLTAVCAHGFEHQYALHRNASVFVADPYVGPRRSSGMVHRLYMPDVPSTVVDGLCVTGARRTLIDCAQRYSFREMLPIFDSAARHGVDLSGLPELCREMGQDSATVVRLCRYADPLSENGGESLARAVMVDHGFMVPQLQREFPNPTNLEAPYRVDFLWELPDGSTIVGEYDGMGKYVLSDARRRTIQAKVHAERERETHLLAQGVTRIVRFEYEDLMHPERLERKLVDAGVPKRR
ncbi:MULTISPECIES: hypothetical protein [Bifidobacterium]|uniref:hypothetical protein n=1 Tax=Bifidobacterium TaxID=1678 RepID=UPI001BDC14C6|nr:MULTISPECIES: hypothetical protein [Bifidobacterium]MBT1162343.1 hypothetical protein [Bifidobacterium sp. SO1]MBW3078805.1 hypothetical protein [Bifidobacterium simiiventris]